MNVGDSHNRDSACLAASRGRGCCVCATFPLIWVGGLVTTYDAGMAVPDWPGTYGYNLFLYPWQTWIGWSLGFVHRTRTSLAGGGRGLDRHRAWSSPAGKCDTRGWLRWLVVAALALVILQGLLGGQRVLLDDRRIAQIHGCVGPLFFTLSVMIAVFTSRWWRTVGETVVPQETGEKVRFGARQLLFTAWITFGLAVLQLVLGSQLRHGIEYLPPSVFRMSVAAHVVGAGLLALQIMWLSWRVWRKGSFAAALGQKIRMPVSCLLLLVTCQLILGIGAWTTKYGWPHVLQGFLALPGYVVQAESMLQSLIVTAHVALGSLILCSSGLVAVRCSRLAWVDKSAVAPAAKNESLPMGVAV